MINGAETTYFVGTHYEVVERETGTQVTKYYYAGTQRIAMRTGTVLSYLLSDHLGSTSLTVDAIGNVISEQRYTAWGEVRFESGATPTKYTYTGQYSYTGDFGLMYYNARWYDPYLNQFIQPDTIVPDPYQPMDWNKYTYVRDNPINYTDPSGHICLDPWAPSGIHFDSNRGCDYPQGSTGGFWWRRDPLGPDTSIIDMPWIDEQSESHWNQYPNTCGAIALYMFLESEGVAVDFPTLVEQLRSERLQTGGYDGYCCSSQIWAGDGTNFLPTPTPYPSGECNKACLSGETLAKVARQYYGLDVSSGDNWTHQSVYQKVKSGHSVLTLVRAGISEDQFGHFVVIRGFTDGGWTVVFNDSYPGEEYWDYKGGSASQREQIGVGRTKDWDTFDASWASSVDPMDPLSPGGHIRWAMAVR